MPSITDKFGRASASGGYALATTVKSTRNVGEKVLSAVDLSKYATDTPIFFITYKKATDPDNPLNTIMTNQTSWKGIVNPDNNTITNMVLAPGYTDTGNVQGDYIECIPSSFWENDLVDGILKEHNGDGTHGNIKDLKVTGTATLPDKSIKANNIDFTTNKFTKLGVITASTFNSTGNKSITGVGFKPSLVKFTLMYPLATTNSSFSTGFIDADGNQYHIYATAQASSVSRGSGSNAAIVSVAGGTTNTVLLAKYVSMDADGFTLNVSTNSAPVDVLYEAYR